MKKTIILLVFLLAAQAQAFIGGDRVLRDITGINYDYDWTGVTPGSKLSCRLVADADGEQELSVSIYYKNKTIQYRVFSLTSEMLFAKSDQGAKVIYTEVQETNNPYAPPRVVEVIYNRKAELATVTLKNGPDDIGAACTVPFDP